MPDLLKKSSYHYELPRELIAQYPLKDRPQSRLMVLDRQSQTISHCHFYDIADFLQSGDVLVLNKTRVIPARLFGSKANGTRIEVFLLDEIETGKWHCLVHPGKRLKQPQILTFSEELAGHISAADEEGVRLISFSYSGNLWQLLEKYGHVPLPPYIERTDEQSDQSAYQTIYASVKGSVAAPTAGLHFTQEILQQLKNKGVIIAELILHVGLGTFRPVKVDDITQHKMHAEYCSITEETAEIINLARKENRRIIAVGTTSVRTLESFFENNMLQAGSKWTDIFIYPGKEIYVVSGMLTNFHLPESTLLMLVSAFAGYEFIRYAYQQAVAEKYRFFSYGDAMLIL
jgi:S-adenosylmethionine:tRNA ribosyltransferase-isomerase